MAVGTKKRKIEPKSLYRAIESVAFVDAQGVPQTLRKDDTVLLGQHEWVQQYPQYFGLEGDPADQQRARMALVDPAEDERIRRSRKSNARVLEVRYRAKRPASLNIDGLEIKVQRGDVLDGSEPIVQFVPDAFEPIEQEAGRG